MEINKQASLSSGSVSQIGRDKVGSNARSISVILANEPEKLDFCVEKTVKLLKRIHREQVPKGKLPDMKESALSQAAYLRNLLPENVGEKLLGLLQAVPQDEHMLLGKLHLGNLELQDDEAMQISENMQAVGNPIFELAAMYASLVGSFESDHEQSMATMGFDYETARGFWRKALSAYLGTSCEHKLREVEDKARIIAYTCLICRANKCGRQNCDEGRRELGAWEQELLGLLGKTDTLLFRTDELELEALRDYNEEVQAFVEERLVPYACTPKTLMQIAVSVEEIFVNIANYAYKPNTGMAWIRAEVSGDPACLTLVFRDRGIPYNPLAREDPDVTLAAEDRKIGGLGIYMTKVFMDEENYAYEDGQNILTLKKIL